MLLEVPRMGMMRNEQSQAQELALEGKVIGNDYMAILKHND